MTDSTQKSPTSRRLSSQKKGTSNNNTVPNVPDLPSWLSPVKNSTGANSALSSSSLSSPTATSPRILTSPQRKSSTGLNKKPREGKSEITKLWELLDNNISNNHHEQSPTSTSSSSSQRHSTATTPTTIRRKASQKQLKDDPSSSSSSSTTETSSSSSLSSKQAKKNKYRAATEEALKTFNELQSVENKIASQTNEVMARMKNLFQSKRENEIDDRGLLFDELG